MAFQFRTNRDEAARVDPGRSRLGRSNNLPRMVRLLVAVPDWRVEECIDENCQVLQAKQAGVRPQQQQYVAL